MRALLLLALALLLTACQTLSSLESPELSVSAIQLNRIGLFEQQWDLTLRARNPNDRPLTLKSLDYDIYINDRKFGRGLTSETVTLPAMGDARVTTSITTNLLSHLRELQQLQQQGEPLSYRLEGQARVGGFPLPLNFDKKGELEMPSLP